MLNKPKKNLHEMPSSFAYDPKAFMPNIFRRTELRELQAKKTEKRLIKKDFAMAKRKQRRKCVIAFSTINLSIILFFLLFT